MRNCFKGKTSEPKAMVFKYFGISVLKVPNVEIIVNADTTQHTVLISCSFKYCTSFNGCMKRVFGTK